jgi:hypothetical protein
MSSSLHSWIQRHFGKDQDKAETKRRNLSIGSMSGLNFSSEPAIPSEIDEWRSKLESGFTQLAQLISAIRAPLPNQTGDGSNLVIKPDSPELIQKINDTLSDLRHLGITDVDTLLKVNSETHTGAPQNDKQYLMERLIMVRL